MIKRLIAAAILTGLGLGTSIASATVIVYQAGLSNEVESPPAALHGAAFAAIALDDLLDTMRVVVRFSPLTGNSTATHIHCCNVVPWTGTAGLATSVPEFVEFPLGVTSKTYDDIMALTLGSDTTGALESGVNPGAH